MYSDDSYVLPASAPMVHGMTDMRAFWGKVMEQLSDVRCTAADVKPLGGSAAREIGTCGFKTKGAAPQDGVLKYAVVWQKAGGQWKLITDIWNMDK